MQKQQDTLSENVSLKMVFQIQMLTITYSIRKAGNEMSSSYVKSRQELHIYKVVTMVESWDDPDKLIEQVSYDLYLDDHYVYSFDSFRELIENGDLD